MFPLRLMSGLVSYSRQGHRTAPVKESIAPFQTSSDGFVPTLIPARFQWPRIRFASNVCYFIFVGYLFDRTTIISDKSFAIVEETMEVCLTRQMHLTMHQRTHLRLCFSFVQSSKRSADTNNG
ncbi:uncharacterized protein LOC122570482 [Bombus pyrosoma]|uniref:uncharacterized protein LOC122570482 n=1 Tax=Bombus pyrosoma TaxID=396416 RepID=UPI001CB9B5AB|nr:uncharacterized protein LOC122570482 [Bombus pyrosoma]